MADTGAPLALALALGPPSGARPPHRELPSASEAGMVPGAAYALVAGGAAGAAAGAAAAETADAKTTFGAHVHCRSSLLL